MHFRRRRLCPSTTLATDIPQERPNGATVTVVATGRSIFDCLPVVLANHTPAWAAAGEHFILLQVSGRGEDDQRA